MLAHEFFYVENNQIYNNENFWKKEFNYESIQEYDYIKIIDDLILKLYKYIKDVDRLNGKSLDYYGVTTISVQYLKDWLIALNEALTYFEVIDRRNRKKKILKKDLKKLIRLFEFAMENNKIVIHYGI